MTSNCGTLGGWLNFLYLHSLRLKICPLTYSFSELMRIKWHHLYGIFRAISALCLINGSYKIHSCLCQRSIPWPQNHSPSTFSILERRFKLFLSQSSQLPVDGLNLAKVVQTVLYTSVQVLKPFLFLLCLLKAGLSASECQQMFLYLNYIH